MRAATRSSRFEARSVEIGSSTSSSSSRSADGQMVLPVFGLTSWDPRTPGMTMIGALPTYSRAGAKIFGRSGLLRGLTHPVAAIAIATSRLRDRLRCRSLERTIRPGV
jgi:hypothetical protein